MKSIKVKMSKIRNGVHFNVSEMKSSHTPGPWVIQKSDNPETGLLIKPIPGQVICEMDALPNMRADARLIAAAPELLEELKFVAEGWEVRAKRTRGTEPLNPWESERFEFIKAAIAKAEGGK